MAFLNVARAHAHTHPHTHQTHTHANIDVQIGIVWYLLVCYRWNGLPRCDRAVERLMFRRSVFVRRWTDGRAWPTRCRSFGCTARDGDDFCAWRRRLTERPTSIGITFGNEWKRDGGGGQLAHTAGSERRHGAATASTRYHRLTRTRAVGGRRWRENVITHVFRARGSETTDWQWSAAADRDRSPPPSTTHPPELERDSDK